MPHPISAPAIPATAAPPAALSRTVPSVPTASTGPTTGITPARTPAPTAAPAGARAGPVADGPAAGEGPSRVGCSRLAASRRPHDAGVGRAGRGEPPAGRP